MKNSVVEAIIFDLGNVLVGVDFSNLFQKYIKEDSENNNLTLDRVMSMPWFRDFSKGKIDSLTFYSKVTEYFQMDLNYDSFCHEWSNVFYPLSEMEALLEEVASSYPVGLLSDTDELHWRFLKKEYHFLDIFKEPVLSFKIGAMKPDPLCYKKAAESVNKPIEKCLFIDDRQVNIDGARRVNMQSLLFNNARDLRNSLKQIIMV